MQIGAKIKRLRKDRGLTQQAFADELNVSFQAVSNWERGITPPDLDNIVQIASFFGILVDELLCPSDEELVLGIDGGGTKTAFALTTLDGRVLRSFTREASNPNSVGVQTTFNILSDGIAEMINTYPSVSSIFCGIAGVASGGCIDYLTDELTKRFQNKKIVIKSDYENIFSLDDDADIAIISGTGSVVCIRQDGESTLIGGWGYIFDKAGSAFDIGRDAICTALEEETFGSESSIISELIKKDLNVSCIRSVLGSVYSRDKSYVASFAKFVFEAYEKGDKKAAEIICTEVGEITVLADYFLMATATSSTHVKALAEEVEYKLEQAGEKNVKVEGRATDWILIDLGDVIIHVFGRQSREFYALDKMWSDGKQVDINKYLNEGEN